MELFRGMGDGEVEDLLEALTAYALRLLRRASWRGQVGNPVPGGREAQDIVLEVVLKYERGITHPGERDARRLNPSVDLVGNLMGGVRSWVDALLQRQENQCEERIETELPDDPGRRRSPERLASYKQETETIYNHLLEAVLDDEQMMAVLELLESRGEYTPGELESALGLTNKEARALRRRFSRALDAAIKAGEEDSNG